MGEDQQKKVEVKGPGDGNMLGRDMPGVELPGTAGDGNPEGEWSEGKSKPNVEGDGNKDGEKSKTRGDSKEFGGSKFGSGLSNGTCLR